VLLISIWGAKKAGVGAITDPVVYMSDVEKCLNFLSAMERKWHSAGRLVDLLRELSSFGELATVSAPIPTGRKLQKRHRSYGSSQDASASGSADSQPPHPRPISKLKASPPMPDIPPHSSTHDFSETPQVTTIQHPEQRWSGSQLTTRFPDQFAYSGQALPLTSATSITTPGWSGPPTPPSMGDVLLHHPYPATGEDATYNVLSVEGALVSSWNVPVAPLVYPYVTSGVEGAGYHDPLTTTFPNVANFVSEDMGIWQTTPGGFQWEDWSTYLSTMIPTTEG